MLPDMDGFEVLRRLRAGRIETPILILSGLNETDAKLKGLGLGLPDVLMVRAYLTHFTEDYAAFNEAYRAHFPADRLPARTCVGVTGLAYDARVEIDLVARRPSST